MNGRRRGAFMQDSYRRSSDTNKIEKVDDLLISLAVIEEKLSNVQNDINSLKNKLEIVEKKVDSNEQVVNVISRLFWILVIAIVGGFGSQIYMGFN